jgi:hypothetical protein
MAVVDLVVKLRDQATAGIRGIGGALSGLGNSAAGAATQTQGLAGALTQGILQANAIQFAIGKATQAIGFMNSKFDEAKNLQLANVTAATTFSSLTGQSYEEAAKFIENLNNRLAKSAATLPGATQDYKNLAIAIQDNVLEAFKDPAGKLNQKGFEDTIASISESFGALSAASNVDTGNTTLGLSKALGGASTGELRQIQFFEQNAVILNEIDKRLQALGKSALKDLDIKDRVKLIEEVGKKFITEDFKKNAGQTADALLQSFQSTLFDPSTGVFGVMRDLDVNTEGVQSAFSSFNEVLNQVIGPQGAFTLLGEVLQAAGINLPDPMAVLKSGLDIVIGGLKQINAGLAGARDLFKGGAGIGDFDLRFLADATAKFIFSIGTGFEGMLRNAGSQSATLFNSGVSILSESLADPLVFYRLGDTLGNVLGRAFGALYNFLARVDYGQLLMGIGRAAIALFVGLAGFANGANEGVSVAMQDALGMMLSSLGDSLKYLILSFTDPIGEQFNAMGTSLGNSANSLINGLKTTIGETVNQAGAAASSFGKSVLEGAVELASGIGSALSQGFQSYLGYLQQQIPVRIAMGTLAVLGTLAQVTGRIIDALATNIGQVVEGWKNEATAATTQAFDRLTSDLSNLYATYITPVSNSANQAMNSAGASIQSAIVAYNGFIDSMSGSVYLALEAGAGLVSGFGASINGYLNQGLSLLRGAWETYSSGVSVLGIEISAQIQPPIDSAIKLVTDIANAISGLVNAGARMVQSAQNAVNSFNPVPAIQSNIESAGQTAVGAINNFFSGAKFSGHVAGNAAGGFLSDLAGAARSEMAAMPSGAKLLVANTTEHIIPQGMLGPLVSATAPSVAPLPRVSDTLPRVGDTASPRASAPPPPPRGGGSIFHLHFPNAGGDPQAIADAVMGAIQQSFETELSNQLS